jgi:hypothetical protein
MDFHSADFLKNTPIDVLELLNKQVFAVALDDMFTEYFESHEQDLSQLYAYYISISKDLRVDNTLEAFLQHFVKYIDKNNINIIFKNGYSPNNHGGFNMCQLSEDTVNDLIVALKKVYRDRKMEDDTSLYRQSTLWHDVHVSFDIKTPDSRKEVLVFRNKVYKEDEKALKLKYDDTYKAFAEFAKKLDGIPHADREIGGILEQFAVLRKVMDDYSKHPETLRNGVLSKFADKMTYVVEHLENLEILLNEYQQDSSCVDLLLFMEDHGRFQIIDRVVEQRMMDEEW